MATMTTAQKTPVKVTDPATGAVLPLAEWAPYTAANAYAAFDPSGFVVAALDANGSPKTGSATISVKLPDGRAGSANITVTAAPLLVEFGTPVPRGTPA